VPRVSRSPARGRRSGVFAPAAKHWPSGPRSQFVIIICRFRHTAWWRQHTVDDERSCDTAIETGGPGAQNRGAPAGTVVGLALSTPSIHCAAHAEAMSARPSSAAETGAAGLSLDERSWAAPLAGPSSAASTASSPARREVEGRQELQRGLVALHFRRHFVRQRCRPRLRARLPSCEKARASSRPCGYLQDFREA
jgi:hypothetical protein